MSQAVIEKLSAPFRVKSPPIPLRHYFCDCQTDFPNGQRLAYCGQLLGVPIYGVPRSPMDLCVLCQDIATDNKPCRHCGRKPRK